MSGRSEATRHNLGRRLLALAGQLLGIAILSAGLIEVAARLVLDVQPLTAGTLLFELDPRRGWRHIAGGEDLFVKLGTRQLVRINSHGLREREIPYEKPEGLFRILVIGDSSVVGFEVPQETVFTRVMEDRLREAGHRVEVINGGHRGYGTDQALLFLMDDGVRYEPDLVLYKWTANDLEDNVTVHRPFRKYGKSWFDLDEDGDLVLRGTPVPLYPYDQGLRVGEDGSLVEMKVTPALRAQTWIRDEVVCRSSFAVVATHVFASVPQLWQVMRERGGYGDFRDGPWDRESHSRAYRITAALLHRMAEVSNEAGAEFRLVASPSDRMRAFQAESGVRALWDPLRIANERGRGRRMTVPFDPHWNELGHELAGEALAEAVREAGLVPPGAPTGRGRQ